MPSLSYHALKVPYSNFCESSKRTIELACTLQRVQIEEFVPNNFHDLKPIAMMWVEVYYLTAESSESLTVLLTYVLI